MGAGQGCVGMSEHTTDVSYMAATQHCLPAFRPRPPPPPAGLLACRLTLVQSSSASAWRPALSSDMARLLRAGSSRGSCCRAVV